MFHLPHCPAAANGWYKKPSGLRSICNARPKLWHDRDEAPRACHGVIRSRTGPSRALLQDTTGTVSAFAWSPSRRQRTQATLWPAVPGQRGLAGRNGCMHHTGWEWMHGPARCMHPHASCVPPATKKKAPAMPGLDMATAGPWPRGAGTLRPWPRERRCGQTSGGTSRRGRSR